jgi:hypothetical protein
MHMVDLIFDRYFVSFGVSYQVLCGIMVHFMVGLRDIIEWWTTLGWFLS